MKKNNPFIITTLGILLSMPIQAQEFVFGYSLGKGNYQMGDMKSILKNDVEQIVKDINTYYKTDFQYKNTESFPGGLFHNAYFGLKFSFHEVGLQYDYFTSGGRNHLADYSGELMKDIVFSGDALGLYYKMYFLSVPLANKFRLSAYTGVATGAIFNRGHYDYFLDLYNPQSRYPGQINSSFEKIDESKSWNSTNWYAQPNIGVQFWFKNSLSLNIGVGYLFDSPGKLRTAEDNTFSSIYVPGQGTIRYEYPGREYDFGATWTGLRLSVGIGFAFQVGNHTCRE